MPWYLVRTHYDHHKIEPARPEHLAYMDDLVRRGKLAVAGPMVDGSGGVLIMRAENDTELWDVLNADPYHLADPTSERSAGEYKPNLGFWLTPDA